MERADPEEVKEAMTEGVKFRYLSAPTEILGEAGKVTDIKLEIMELGKPDEKGRRKPVGTGKLEKSAKGTALADALTYQTAEPDIFVGGDVYTGPKFAIDAIAAGKEAAIPLHRYVHPGQTLTMGRDRRVYSALNPVFIYKALT